MGVRVQRPVRPMDGCAHNIDLFSLMLRLDLVFTLAHRPKGLVQC